MFVCVYSVCVVLCVGSGIATGWSPVQGVLPTLYNIKKLKSGQGPTKGCRSIDRYVKRRKGMVLNWLSLVITFIITFMVYLTTLLVTKTQFVCLYSLSLSLFSVAPTWSVGHPWNALFHFSFFILRQSADLLWRGISPSQARYLHRTTQTQNKRRQADRHASIEIRTHDSSVQASENISCLRLRGQYDRPFTYINEW
jgi:hypothetical protein